jgi:hypothetical protein
MSRPARSHKRNRTRQNTHMAQPYERTAAELMVEAAAQLDYPTCRGEVLLWFAEHYPGLKPSTIRAHIVGLTANDRNRHHDAWLARREPLFTRHPEGRSGALKARRMKCRMRPRTRTWRRRRHSGSRPVEYRMRKAPAHHAAPQLSSRDRRQRARPRERRPADECDRVNRPSRRRARRRKGGPRIRIPQTLVAYALPVLGSVRKH